jgi:UPF0755 protein
MKKLRNILCAVFVLLLAVSFSACSKAAVDETTEDGAEADTQITVIAADGTTQTVAVPNGSDTPAQNSERKNSGAANNNVDVQEPENPAGGSGQRETVRVTITEGMTLTQIFKKLEANGVCSFDDLMKTAESYDYSYYPLIAARPSNTRAFKLEGYLFPNTYDFYKNEKPQDAIGRFLRVGEKYITSQDRAKARAMGYSMDQILTVASIIEKEGANPNEVRKIAAVIYNRLEAGKQLQMDSGIYYIERSVKPYISGDVNRYNSLYNMYKCKGLPAGPICNPGARTINAALDPADVNYLYFCHDSSAKYYYADTYEEHLENLKKAGIAS